MKPMRLLVSALLLCSLAACRGPGEPSPSQTPEPLPAATPAPAPSSVPSSLPSSSPAASAPTGETPGYSVALPDGIPEKIVLDTDEIGIRYYAETTPALRPRPDYGRLYPFVGAGAKGHYIRDVQLLFGLCTADGRVVVDPVYNSAEMVEKDGNEIYLLQRYADYRYETTFAALDGSWAVTYQDNDRREMSFEGEFVDNPPQPDYISVYNGNGWGAVDYTGKEVYPCRERFPVQFCEGLAAVWSDDGEKYGYLTVGGELELGIFDAPERLEDTKALWWYDEQKLHFSQGLARFKQDGLWGYIDKRGEVVIEPQYKHASSFFDNYAIVADAGYNHSAIDRAGNVLVSVEGRVTPLDGTMFWVTDWGSDNKSLMNSAGELVQMSIIPFRRLQNGWWIAQSDGEYTVLEKDGEVIGMPFHVMQGMPDDRFIVYVYQDDRTLWNVADKAGNLLMENQEGAPSLLPSGRIRTEVWGNYTSRYGLWDANLTPVLPMKYRYLAEFGDFFAVQDGHFGGLLDREGNWVVKRWLLDSMMD